MMVAGTIDRSWIRETPYRNSILQLADGRTVTFILPLTKPTEEKKCTIQTKCSSMDCVDCYDNSHASVNTVLRWADNRTVPRMISIKSHEMYWYNCHKCNHYFDMQPSAVSRGIGCPVCPKAYKRICLSEACKRCHKRTIASTPAVSRWSYELNKVSPRNVKLTSDCRFYYKCMGKDCKETILLPLSEVSYTKLCYKCLGYDLPVKTPTVKKVVTKKVVENIMSLVDHPVSKYVISKDYPPLSINSSKSVVYKCGDTFCGYKCEVPLRSVIGGRKCTNCDRRWMDVELERFCMNYNIEFYKDFQLENFKDYTYSYKILISGFSMIVELDTSMYFDRRNIKKMLEKISKQERALMYGYYFVRIDYTSDIYSFIKQTVLNIPNLDKGKVMYSKDNMYEQYRKTLTEPVLVERKITFTKKEKEVCKQLLSFLHGT